MSGRYTNHPVSDEKWYEEKCKDFHDGKCDSYGREIVNDTDKQKQSHNSLGMNPLENPEQYTVRLYCNKCRNRFDMGLKKHNDLTGNCGYFDVMKKAEIKLCPKCFKKYIKKQISLEKRGLLTDVLVQELAKKSMNQHYGWQYQVGFMDGYIKMRDGKANILSEIQTI